MVEADPCNNAHSGCDNDDIELENHGHCLVCLYRIENEVKMCPECNAIFCQPCIDQLRKTECPKCRRKVKKRSYVRNRPMEDMIK